ncbi:cyclase family protein [Flavivirga algicola]|nr:cyclase family protein [Flavivirga algicola]
MGTIAQEPNKENPITKEVISEWMNELSNWGRWGKDDELGTLNLITPKKRKEAASLVTEGISISLARDISKKATRNNPHPLKQSITLEAWAGHNWASDTYTMRYHGNDYSHIDALCHIFYKGNMYNGFSQNLVKKNGAEKLDIQKMNTGIFTRGILVDMPLLKNVTYLKKEDIIKPEHMVAWEKKTGIKIKRGDVLLIRTGRWSRSKEEGVWNFGEDAVGLHPTMVKWLKERDVAVIGSDGVSDKYPSGIEGLGAPIHQLLLVALGMPLLDNLQLEALAAKAASLNRWEFLFVAAPLRIPGGTGSPINPIATF